MATPGGYTTFFNLILPTVGGNAVDWATWTNQNWQSVDTALQNLTDGKLSLNPEDGTLYGRLNDEWVAIEVNGTEVTIGIGEAPNDGNPYLRQSQAWVGATSIIEGIAETAVDAALAPSVRSRLTTSIPQFGLETVLNETISHADIRDKTAKIQIVGYVNAAADFSPNHYVIEFVLRRLSTGVSAIGFSVTFEPVAYPAVVPFVFEAEIADFLGANQVYTAEVRMADPQGLLGTRTDSTAPGQIVGAIGVYEGALDLTGVGTKDIEVDVSLTSGSAASTVEVRKVVLFVEER